MTHRMPRTRRRIRFRRTGYALRVSRNCPRWMWGCPVCNPVAKRRRDRHVAAALDEGLAEFHRRLVGR